MLDIASLKALIPSLDTLHSSSLEPPKRVPARARHPRDNVIALIENNLTLLANPDHVFFNKRTKKPLKIERCFKISPDGMAHISLAYAKQKLILGEKESNIIVVPVAELPKTLELIKQQVVDGILDKQIEPIHKKRSDKMKNKKKTDADGGNSLKKSP